jgi:hypothetical protein
VQQSEVVDLVVAVLLLLPEGQVLLEELDNALGISEVVFLELVDLVESILEGLVGKLASSLVVLHDFVVEDGEVEGETELDGVARGQGDLVGFVVCLKSILLDLLHEGTLCVLSDVAVVVADHLDEESLGLSIAGLSEHLLVDDVNNALAVAVELVLDVGLVVSEGTLVLGVLGVGFDGSDGAASSTLGADQVLERDGKKVALIGADLSTFSVKDQGEEVDHVFEALGLFGNTCEEDVFFN